MPRNGSGQYSAPSNSWNPAINGVPATAADWQAVLNDIVSALTQSVSRDGQTSMTGNLPMGSTKLTGLGAGTASGDSLRFEQLFSQGQQQDIASAATMDIGAPLTTLLNVTGATTITSFGTNYNGPRFLRFAGACTLTHSASLVLPGGANITTAAGDSLIAVPLGSPATGWRVAAYQLGAVVPGSIPDESVTFAKLQNIATARLLGRATAGTGDVEELTGAQAQSLLPVQQTRVDVASAATVNLTTGAANTDHINITGTTTITAFTVAAGRLIFVRFAGALTLTNNASIVTQSGANISTQAGDTCILRATAANTVEVLCYARFRAGINLGTSVASTSGTAIDFTGIPAGVRRVTVIFDGVSLAGSAPIIIRLGDAGGIETTGYQTQVWTASTTSGVNTTGVNLSDVGLASSVFIGVVTFSLLSGNTWLATGISNATNASNVGWQTVATKTLSDTLDRVRITTPTGAVDFDAGSINISLEF